MCRNKKLIANELRPNLLLNVISNKIKLDSIITKNMSKWDPNASLSAW